MQKFILILFISLLSSFFILSHCQVIQKQVETREQLWLGYFNQTRISKRFGIWADVNWRTTDDFIKQKFQFITHNGLTYFINDNVRLTAGYTYSYLYPDNLLPGRPEHRPWQQLWWRQNYNKFQTLQWLRFEQRFKRKVENGKLTDDYNFNYRIRYNFALNIPLKGNKIEPKVPFFIIMDEIFINTGKEINYNYFDNNRFFIGFGYQFSKQITCHLGYMNLFQQEAGGYKYNNTNAIRFFIFHSLDLRNVNKK